MSTDTEMDAEQRVKDCLAAAMDAVGPAWPLHSFVTANPLAGFEDEPFTAAVAAGTRLFEGNGYPSTAVFRQAWADGRIDPALLRAMLAEHGYEADPDALLDRMAQAEREDTSDATDADAATTATERVEAILTKWLAAFLDQGRAHWPMPDRSQGFYTAFRSVARHDRTIPNHTRITDYPDQPIETVAAILADYPATDWEPILEYHAAGLPGWTGYIKQQAARGDAWQSHHPITPAGYLAARLLLADLLGAPIHPEEAADSEQDDNTTASDTKPLPAVWLSAWEATYRQELVAAIADASATRAETAPDDSRPDAQFVFCIDTRSELIRRQIEAVGDYETYGYAGFFGIPMRYRAYDTDVTTTACPPIVEAKHEIESRPTGRQDDTQDRYDRWASLREAGRELIETLETNAATVFSFVESAGLGYGAALAARTLLPNRVYDTLAAVDRTVPDEHEFCAPVVDETGHPDDEGYEELSRAAKVEYAAAAFERMGWDQFARVVVIAGHSSQTPNNPFDSSLDCGACAGNPGGPNARVLAAICNEDPVRTRLRERGIDIPEETVFVAGEHNTTTNEVALYTGDVPASHTADIEQLRADLATARTNAAAERAAAMGADPDAGVRETTRRTVDWSETRPEWGLAGNAGFVIGPRELTDELVLDDRVFLHAYDWTTDSDGDALAAILRGPLVVAQWINTQYYFATVDRAVYGSGSKVTHNPVGNIGVYQGNGGDLMTGLPVQSLMRGHEDPYHQPLRLSAVVHAPVDRVSTVLADQDQVTQLLDNNWLSLTVVDPTRDHQPFQYEEGINWRPMTEGVDRSETTPATAKADHSKQRSERTQVDAS